MVPNIGIEHSDLGLMPLAAAAFDQILLVTDIISKTWVVKNERDAYNIYEALVITITHGCHYLVPTYCPPLLIRSISHTYILDISKNNFKPLVKLNFVQSVENPYSNSYKHLSVGRMDPTEKIIIFLSVEDNPTGTFWFPVVTGAPTHPCKSLDIGMAIRPLAASSAPRRCCGHKCVEAAGHMARWRWWRTQWAGPLGGYWLCRPPVKPRTNMKKHMA